MSSSNSPLQREEYALYQEEIKKDESEVISLDTLALHEEIAGIINPDKDSRVPIILNSNELLRDSCYRTIAKLNLYFNGPPYGGTGTLVGPCHVLTAAHNVCRKEKGNVVFAKKITASFCVTPSNKEGEISSQVARIIYSSLWEAHLNRCTEQRQDVICGYDIALLILEKPIGMKLGWLGMFCSQTIPDIRSKVYLAGYPKRVGRHPEELRTDKGLATDYKGLATDYKDFETKGKTVPEFMQMWESESLFSSIKWYESFLLHQNESSGGESGAALRCAIDVSRDNNQTVELKNQIFAVHTSGIEKSFTIRNEQIDRPCNVASLISREVFFTFALSIDEKYCPISPCIFSYMYNIFFEKKDECEPQFDPLEGTKEITYGQLFSSVLRLLYPNGIKSELEMFVPPVLLVDQSTQTAVDHVVKQQCIELKFRENKDTFAPYDGDVSVRMIKDSIGKICNVYFFSDDEKAQTVKDFFLKDRKSRRDLDTLCSDFSYGTNIIFQGLKGRKELSSNNPNRLSDAQYYFYLYNQQVILLCLLIELKQIGDDNGNQVENHIVETYKEGRKLVDQARRFWRDDHQNVETSCVTVGSVPTLSNNQDRYLLNQTQSYLTALYTAVHASKAGPKITVIHGAGGMGKSTLAAQYVKEALENNAYDLVVWINAENEEDIKNKFLDVIRKLEFYARAQKIDLQPCPLTKESELDVILAKMNDLLELKIRNFPLFIFDNAPGYRTAGRAAEGEPLYNDVAPCLPNVGHVIVTTQMDPGDLQSAVRVGCFSVPEAVSYVKKRLKMVDDSKLEQVKVLVQKLDCHPLALSIACGYILDDDIDESLEHDSWVVDIDSFLSQYDNQFRAFATYQENDHMSKSLYTMLHMSLGKLSDEQKDLFFKLCFLQPDSIPSEIIKNGASFRRLCLSLRKKNLIDLTITPSKDIKFISMHRLVQEVGIMLLQIKETEERKEIIKPLMNDLYQLFINYSIHLKNKSKDENASLDLLMTLQESALHFRANVRSIEKHALKLNQQTFKLFELIMQHFLYNITEIAFNRYGGDAFKLHTSLSITQEEYLGLKEMLQNSIDVITLPVLSKFYLIPVEKRSFIIHKIKQLLDNSQIRQPELFADLCTFCYNESDDFFENIKAQLGGDTVDLDQIAAWIVVKKFVDDQSKGMAVLELIRRFGLSDFHLIQKLVIAAKGMSSFHFEFLKKIDASFNEIECFKNISEDTLRNIDATFHAVINSQTRAFEIATFAEYVGNNTWWQNLPENEKIDYVRTVQDIMTANNIEINKIVFLKESFIYKNAKNIINFVQGMKKLSVPFVRDGKVAAVLLKEFCFFLANNNINSRYLNEPLEGTPEDPFFPKEFTHIGRNWRFKIRESDITTNFASCCLDCATNPNERFISYRTAVSLYGDGVEERIASIGDKNNDFIDVLRAEHVIEEEIPFYDDCILMGCILDALWENRIALEDVWGNFLEKGGKVFDLLSKDAPLCDAQNADIKRLSPAKYGVVLYNFIKQMTNDDETNTAYFEKLERLYPHLLGSQILIRIMAIHLISKILPQRLNEVEMLLAFSSSDDFITTILYYAGKSEQEWMDFKARCLDILKNNESYYTVGAIQKDFMSFPPFINELSRLDTTLISKITQ